MHSRVFSAVGTHEAFDNNKNLAQFYFEYFFFCPSEPKPLQRHSALATQIVVKDGIELVAELKCTRSMILMSFT